MRGLIAAMLVLGLGPAAAQAPGMTWPEAAELLQRERMSAEACARVVKRFTPKYPVTALAASELEYETARAEFNAVIGGLQVALIENAEAPPLATVEARLATGTAARRAFCEKAKALAPPSDPFVKGSIGEAIAGTISEVIKAGVTIWSKLRDSDQARRDSLRSALEEAKWPAFAAVPTS
jgi:hypothetical protein